MAEIFNQKVAKCGNYVEVRRYSVPVIRGFTRTSYSYRHKDPFTGETETGSTEKRSDNVSRAKGRLVRKVLANSRTMRPLFLTLTYRDNMSDRGDAVRDTQAFVRHIKETHGDIKYLYVLETQDRGAWHCHMLIFNYKFIDVDLIRLAWDMASNQDGARVDIKKTENAKHVAFYLAKYLGKEFVTLNARAYTSSWGLSDAEFDYYFKYLHVKPNKLEHVWSGAWFAADRTQFIELNIYYDSDSC